MSVPGKPVRTVGIITKSRDAKALTLGKKLFRWLQERGITPLPDQGTADALDEKAWEEREIARNSDLLIALGGDGTFLHAASLPAEHPVPILGVNLGGLGFLTESTPDELFPILEDIQGGNIQVEERIRIEAECHRGKESIFWGSALNDIFLAGGDSDRLTVFNVAINSEFLTNYRADGIIIATPTGSTAYNLSAGGPIVHPSHQAIILTPVCPHTLTQRPVILPDSTRVRITLPSSAERTILSLDGQTRWPIREGDEIEIRKHPVPTLLVCPPDRGFFQILHTKLHWGQR